MIDLNETRINKYKEYLLNVKNLPSIPLVMLEVTRMLDNPVTGASELGRTISRDQGLVAKILTVANSPLYGLPRKVSTIEFAIVVLGFDQIKNIVVAMSMLDTFHGKSDRYWNKRSYWLHSMMTAGAAKRIADDLGYPKSGEAFTAGLLHDLGISVMQRYFNDEFQSICEIVEVNRISFLEAERNKLEFDHQDIGKILAEKWNLPSPLTEAITYHHTPSFSENNRSLTAIVHLADYMSEKFDLGRFRWDNNIILDETVIDILKLGNESYLNRFIESYKIPLKKQLELFAL